MNDGCRWQPSVTCRLHLSALQPLPCSPCSCPALRCPALLFPAPPPTTPRVEVAWFIVAHSLTTRAGVDGGGGWRSFNSLCQGGGAEVQGGGNTLTAAAAAAAATALHSLAALATRSACTAYRRRYCIVARCCSKIAPRRRRVTSPAGAAHVHAEIKKRRDAGAEQGAQQNQPDGRTT